MKDFDWYLNNFHLISPTQALVVYLFSGHHYAARVEEIIGCFERNSVHVDPLMLQSALDYFTHKGCLARSIDGRYFKPNTYISNPIPA